jgi:hypothetical protein
MKSVHLSCKSPCMADTYVRIRHEEGGENLRSVLSPVIQGEYSSQVDRNPPCTMTQTFLNNHRRVTPHFYPGTSANVS